MPQLHCKDFCVWVLVGMGLLGKRVHLAQYLAHISPSTSPTSRPLSRPTHQAPGPPEVCDGDCHCHNTYMYISKGLFSLHGPPGKERFAGSCFQAFMFTSFAGVPRGSVPCTVVERQERAHTDTKEGKTQANHGLCRGLSILLAEIRSRCAMGTMWDLLL